MCQIRVRRDNESRISTQWHGHRRQVPEVSHLPSRRKARGHEHGGKAEGAEKAQTSPFRKTCMARGSLHGLTPSAPWSLADPSAERLKTRRVRARDSKEVTRPHRWGQRTFEGKMGGNEPSQRHARATSTMLRYGLSKARDCLQGAHPKATELPEESEDGQTVSRGREETKKPNGEGKQGSSMSRTKKDARGAQPRRS